MHMPSPCTVPYGLGPACLTPPRPQVHTVLRNLGHPTDLVAWGDSLAFCDGLNNSVWAFTGITGADMQQDDSPWATAGRLTLLSGSNDPASGMYAEAATAGADARFWEPLGITHDARRGVLYVADYRNRVIRSVDPLTGATLAVVGDRSSVVKIQDHATSPLLAALCGPTGLYYHYATDAVYFSDRNPDAIMGAMRVWYVQEGRVATIVGQAAGRLTQDGQVSNSQVGTSAIWGLVVGAGGRSSTSPDWWGFTEADRHVLRVVGNSEAQADKVPCEVGKFFNATACVLCTNRRPDLAAYITAGATGEGLCAWRCPDPPLYMPYACPEFAAPVPNAALATTDGTAQLFVCDQGFSKATASNTAPCRACPADLYCEGYNHAGTGEQACPLYSVSPVGSTSRAACTCIGGYRRTADGGCALCPAGTYCPPGTDGEALACPTNSASDAGNSSSCLLSLSLSLSPFLACSLHGDVP